MKKLVIPIRLPNPGVNENIELPSNGIPKSVVMGLEKVTGIVGPEFAGKHALRPVISIIVECTPELDDEGNIQRPDTVKRHFIICQSGEIIEGTWLDYVGTVPDPQSGALLHVFELFSAAPTT